MCAIVELTSKWWREMVMRSWVSGQYSTRLIFASCQTRKSISKLKYSNILSMPYISECRFSYTAFCSVDIIEIFFFFGGGTDKRDFIVGLFRSTERRVSQNILSLHNTLQ